MKRTLADAVAEAAENLKPKKPTLRRFTWCRIHHELLRKPLWRLVARMAGAPLPYVKLLVVELEVFASENDPRGSVEGFSMPAMAADWGLSGDEQLARIYATLEHPEIGWLDQGFIVTFWARNPDHEITEREREQARVRQQKARDRKKGAEDARHAGSYPASRVTQRDSVTSRTRSDQIIQQEDGNFDESKIEQTVMRHCYCSESKAKMFIKRWRKGLSDDLVMLMRVIDDAVALQLAGGRFVDRIAREVSRLRFEAKGLPLPFSPTLQRGGEKA